MHFVIYCYLYLITYFINCCLYYCVAFCLSHIRSPSSGWDVISNSEGLWLVKVCVFICLKTSLFHIQSWMIVWMGIKLKVKNCFSQYLKSIVFWHLLLVRSLSHCHAFAIMCLFPGNYHDFLFLSDTRFSFWCQVRDLFYLTVLAFVGCFQSEDMSFLDSGKLLAIRSMTYLSHILTSLSHFYSNLLMLHSRWFFSMGL